MTNPHPSVCAVVVTHRRVTQLEISLTHLISQTHPIDHLIVIDNDHDHAVKQLVDSQSIPTTYLGSQRNLGGAGGFALGMLYALSLGAEWIWLADDDGRPATNDVLAQLLECAHRYQLAEVSPLVCNCDDPTYLAFPLRRGLRWHRHVSQLRSKTDQMFLAGIASLFNGALFRAETLQIVGVPDLRLFLRGDEVEIHRRLSRSGVAFGTCLAAQYLHPSGTEEFHPIFGGWMHTQYPDSFAKRYFTYRNRGYLMSQPGMRHLWLQEWLRFSWFFLIVRRDLAGWTQWRQLHRLGRHEHFFPLKGQ